MIYINAMGLLCPLGNSLSEVSSSLSSRTSPGMYPDGDFMQDRREVFLGHVTEPCDDLDLGRFPLHDSRNNRLLLKALLQIGGSVEEAIGRYGKDRVGVVLGTSTSGLGEGDVFVCDLQEGRQNTHYVYNQQELGDPSVFLSDYLGTSSASYTISTACSSSPKAVISAMALIESGAIDAAVVGGCDTLNRMTVNGFNSMELFSADLCMPFCRDRHGITIGEAAGLMLISREKSDLALLAGGHSSDAHHISSPHPEGKGAVMAINQALEMAGCSASDIGYINMHGTGTRMNDKVEASVISRLFPDTPCSSTKYLTGHTLGAAGICELIISALILRDDINLPVQDFSRSPADPELDPCSFVTGEQKLRRGLILSNSFAFGGSNAALIVGRA